MQIRVRSGSLTDGDEMLLVNASNTIARLGTGVSHAIRVSCGDDFQDRIVEDMTAVFGGPMAPGDVFVTDAGEHPRARFVAHVAVMDYREGVTEAFPDADRIRRGCNRLWHVVDELPGPLTIAMVALGGGTGGLGVSMPTEIACETLLAHHADGGGNAVAGVTFYGFRDDEFQTMTEMVKRFFPEADADRTPSA